MCHSDITSIVLPCGARVSAFLHCNYASIVCLCGAHLLVPASSSLRVLAKMRSLKRQRTSPARPRDGSLAKLVATLLMFAKNMMMDVADSDLDSIAAGMGAILTNTGLGHVRTGSMCSGSGIGPLAVECALDRARRLRPLPPTACDFLCESDRAKAEYLESQRIAPIIFKTIECMGQPVASEWASATLKNVPEVDILEFGFSCKDLSGLNLASSRMQGYVADVFQQFLQHLKDPGIAMPSELEGTTLPTLLGALKYICAQRPMVAISENVSNVECLIPLLKEFYNMCGYTFWWSKRIGPQMFRVPNSRPRIYMVAMRRNAFSMDVVVRFKLSMDNFTETVDGGFNQTPMIQIETFLLPANDDYFHESHVKASVINETGEWIAKHDDAFRDEGLARPKQEDLARFSESLPSRGVE